MTLPEFVLRVLPSQSAFKELVEEPLEHMSTMAREHGTKFRGDRQAIDALDGAGVRAERNQKRGSATFSRASHNALSPTQQRIAAAAAAAAGEERGGGGRNGGGQAGRAGSDDGWERAPARRR